MYNPCYTNFTVDTLDQNIHKLQCIRGEVQVHARNFCHSNHEFLLPLYTQRLFVLVGVSVVLGDQLLHTAIVRGLVPELAVHARTCILKVTALP